MLQVMILVQISYVSENILKLQDDLERSFEINMP